MPNKHYVMPLIISSVPSSLDWTKLREFLFPVSKNMCFNITEIASFAYSEIPF